MSIDSYVEYLEHLEGAQKADKELILTLHKDCKIFLESIRFAQKCFRGSLKGFSGNFVKIKPRTNRKPSDLPIEAHRALNIEFKKRFGWNPRSEGVFVAPNVYISDEYGTSYYFFPIGKFKMVYNEKVQDILLYLDSQRVITGDSLTNDWRMTTHDRPDDYFKKLVSGYTQEINSAKKALYSGVEIMCQCKSYYMVDVKWVTKWYSEVFANSEGGDNPWK